MNDREAMKMALEALFEAQDEIREWGGYASDYFQKKHDLLGSIAKLQPVINTLRQALAQPEPIKVLDSGIGKWLTVVYKDVQAGDEVRQIIEHPKMSAVSWTHAINDRDAALAQTEQEKESTALTVDPRLLLGRSNNFTKETKNRLCDIERRLASIETQPTLSQPANQSDCGHKEYKPLCQMCMATKQKPVEWDDDEWVKTAQEMSGDFVKRSKAHWESTPKPEQGCAECGVKASDGYALYCVACAEKFVGGYKENVPVHTSELLTQVSTDNHYSGNGTAGIENVTKPTGFFFQMPPEEEPFNRLVRIMGTFDLATGHADNWNDLLDSLEQELRDVLGHYREALKAQPEQDEGVDGSVRVFFKRDGAWERVDSYEKALNALASLAQPEQEPVAWEYQEYRSAFMGNLQWFDTVQFVQPPNDPELFRNIKPLYTAPPKPWVGLTDEEILEIEQDSKEFDYLIPHLFARSIEAALRSKNT